VEDSDEGADEVVGIGVSAEIAVGDRPLDGADEGSVDERAGAFKQAHAAGGGVHCGEDELLFGDVVDEEKHPGAKRFKRGHGDREALFGSGKLFDFVAVDGSNKVIAGWEVAIEGGVADAGPACDVVEARSCAIAAEDFLGYLKDAFTIALRVGAGFACWRGWRELLGGHRNRNENFMQPGSIPVYLTKWGLFPFYATETKMSIGATFTDSATTTGE
jgi:hypothetical protein